MRGLLRKGGKSRSPPPSLPRARERLFWHHLFQREIDHFPARNRIQVVLLFFICIFGGEELPFPRPVIRSWGCMRAWEGEEDAREAGSAWKCVHERDTSCERRLWYDANIRIKGDTYIRTHTSKRIDIHTHTRVRLCVCVLVTLVILPRQYTHVRFEIHYPKDL